MASTRPGKLFRIIFYILVAIVISVIGKNIYTKQMQIRHLKKESAALDKKISNIKDRIRSIKRDISMAKDPNYIKHKAKDEYLMLDKDESVIIFHDN